MSFLFPISSRRPLLLLCITSLALQARSSSFLSYWETMDSEVSAAQLEMQGENPSREPLKKLDDGSSVYEADKGVVQEPPPSVTDGTASLGPITPDNNRENGESQFDFKSPLTLVSSPPKAVCVDPYGDDDTISSVDCSPRTPKEGVFDPFAPGPDELAMAPLCKKYLDDSRTSVARRLNFDSSLEFVGDGNCNERAHSLPGDEMMFESVYGNLLEAIVSKQTEGVLASDYDGCKTPTSVPRLNGVAETCPGTPVKFARKPRNIDQGLCRKLEF